ncbi:MAG: hypothetical protein IKX00_05175 [Bacilli bacterium]|nr:hypothetical protein [Bacilli bacterium]
MNILLANVIVYLNRYLVFFKSLFIKHKYAYLLIDILKWEILAYAFSLVGGYSATLCYMFLIVYEVMKFTLMNKNILIDILVFIIPASFIYLSGKHGIIFLLPFIALFINMVIKPILRKYKKDNKYTDILIDLLICIYAYQYKLIVLFIFELFKVIFPVVGTSIKNITTFANKRIN